jgi:hypothetical protein
MWVETTQQRIRRRLVDASHVSQNVISVKIATLEGRKFLELLEGVRFRPGNYFKMDVKAF